MALPTALPMIRLAMTDRRRLHLLLLGVLVVLAGGSGGVGAAPTRTPDPTLRSLGALDERLARARTDAGQGGEHRPALSRVERDLDRARRAVRDGDRLVAACMVRVAAGRLELVEARLRLARLRVDIARATARRAKLRQVVAGKQRRLARRQGHLDALRTMR